MNEAETALAELDAALAEFGETVRVQRLTLGPGGTQIPFECQCQAAVSLYQPQELVGGIIQGDSKVVLSPTPFIQAGWPGGFVAVGDSRFPRKGDRVFIDGRARTVQAAAPFTVGDTLVRLELQVRG